ncbi:hypothetical protein FO519_006749 [Halicephalobus sp. NKZ332]|nr:hypothetical protein FO519_006749 [Halicephalobus sp. NKZ332]
MILRVKRKVTNFAEDIYSTDISFDARKGFETRGSPLSEARLTLQHLIDSAASSTEVIFGRKNKTKRAIEITDPPIISSTDQPPPDSFTINYDDYGVDEEDDEDREISPCEQFYALGKSKLPYTSIDFLGKAIFEISDFDTLFKLETVKKLCELDPAIHRVMRRTKQIDFVSKIPFSFHFPYYTWCTNMSYIKSCDDLKQENVDSFKELVLSCLDPNSTDENCQTNIARELTDYIFQRSEHPGMIPKGPIFIGTVLRVYHNFMVTASPDARFEFYSTLFRELTAVYRNDPNIKLKGLGFFAKEILFGKDLLGDVKLGVLAVVIVVSGILVYTRSLILTAIVFFGMITAVGTSFYIYACILKIQFFPFINLLVIVIAIAVGTDDAFLLSYQFEKQKRALKVKNAKILKIDPELLPPTMKRGYSYNFNSEEDLKVKDALRSRHELVKSALKLALDHAASAMFVTSATTAAAFLTNYFSNIVILRCFGIFAGITILVNYLFVVTGLPAAIILLNCHRFFKHGIHVEMQDSVFMRIKTCGRIITDWYIYKLPVFVYRIHKFIILISSFLAIISFYVVTVNPGIRLPENNALQLLRSDHPFEWFDENESRLFNFSANRFYKLNVFALWGVQPTRDASPIMVNNTGTFSIDPDFKITRPFLKSLEQQVEILSNSRIILHENSASWISQFISWADKCSVPSCCFSNSTTLNTTCMRTFAQKTATITGRPSIFPTRKIVDSPIFEKETMKFLGYFFQGPSTTQFSNIFGDLQPLFRYFNYLKSFLSGISSIKPPMILSNPDTSNLFDLLNSLLHGTLTSVMVSIGVSAIVVALSTIRPLLTLAAIISIGFAIVSITAALLLLEWTINVVEATILVISIGLCFDYTLHLAVAYKLAEDLVVTERIREANEACGIPIALAALTNISAGIVLLFSKTQSFYEIGVFLIVMAVISFLVAHFTFVSLVFFFSGVVKSGKV